MWIEVLQGLGFWSLPLALFSLWALRKLHPIRRMKGRLESRG